MNSTGTEQVTNQVPFESVNHNQTSIMPTASEIGYLWSSYFAETMSVCMLKHIVAKSKNSDFRSIFQQALEYSSERVKGIEDIFNSFYHPIPAAFCENDVDINVRELFSESFMLSYTQTTNEFILDNYSEAYNNSSKTSVRTFFSRCIDTTRDIINKADDVLLAKGLYIKTPYIVIPDKIDFVEDKNYTGSFFGSNRPLNALEISHIYTIIRKKLVLSTLTLGLAQVAKDEMIRKYLVRGTEITTSQIQDLSSLLHEWNLPVPTTADFEISTSTDSPFSDKLILFHTTTVKAYIISNLGRALTNSARKDIIKILLGSITELLNFSKDGLDLMIENNWLERLPETADRRELVQ